MFTAENYEVIKFIEHGGKCRIIMDCVSGRLLSERLNDRREITKEKIYKWFYMLTGELEKYQRCKNGQCYRYINPCSILVTHQDKILLLDLSAQSNDFVMKNMQKPAMREHFVNPIIQIHENSRLAVDLYGLGKTMQFILAYTEDYIGHTRREEYLLSGIIEKCLGENPKRKYENLKQIQKELPRIVCKEQKKQQRKTIFIIVAVVFLLAGICTIKAVSEKRDTAGSVEASSALECTRGSRFAASSVGLDFGTLLPAEINR